MPRSLQEQIKDAIDRAEPTPTYTDIANAMTKAGRKVTPAIVGQWATKPKKTENIERKNLDALIKVLGLNRSEAWIAALNLDVEPPPISDKALGIAEKYDDLGPMSQGAVEHILNALLVVEDPKQAKMEKRIVTVQRRLQKK